MSRRSFAFSITKHLFMRLASFFPLQARSLVNLYTKMASVKKASFAMGCFWGTEALFGVTKGVLRTKVGYAGGSSLNPTYRNIADHIETVELEYDENIISYEVCFF